MKITVVVCTYNRCTIIERLLGSIAGSGVNAPCDWECIVVDNNSTDETHQVVNRFCEKLPQHFRYVFEEEQGLSHARNRGIAEAAGEIVAFVDDDVVVEASWLRQITACFADPLCAGAGGRILPDRQFTLPKWLSVRTLREGGALPLFDAGESESWLNQAPYGANM